MDKRVIFAVAGSGKTTLLIRRLSEDRRTLLLTFTVNNEAHLRGHCCKVSDEAAFCLIQRPYISKTLLT
ncbi:hypothetical protein VC161_22215, partial [Citrobacter koseri]|nr:hypothetical protein [Citrobacter koseri]